jgi:hypothetical protein
MVGEPGATGTRHQKEWRMKEKRGITLRFGPLGLSLLAAGITAVGVAAVSLADSGGGNNSGSGDNGNGARTFEFHGPRGAGPGVAIAGPDLSAEDRQKLEEFRQCMEDNGAPAPPDPGEIDPSDGPPERPSADDREQLRKAFEACKERLPEKLRNAGPPGLHFRGCAPGEVAPGTEERGRNQNQSKDSGTSSSGSAA